MKNVARTVGFKPGERNIFFHILTACNLSCRHCYINKKQHGTEQLSKEQILQWMTLFADADKKSNMIFLGGEPTLPAAWRVVERLSAAFLEVTAGHHRPDARKLFESLGYDGPLAALSKVRVNLADYFKESVAVVTNPAIDHVRESEAFSTSSMVGVGSTHRV